MAVSVSLATEEASIPAAYRLYLPEAWANDKGRRKQAGVPKEISFQTKPDIALTQIRLQVNEDVPRGRPKTEKEPTKYWLSNLHASINLCKLVAIARLRWRIERDHEELKQELDLGHFEGRNWRGFHHHETLSIVTYSFLVLERCLFPRSHSKQPKSRFTYPVCNPTTRPRRCPFRQNSIIHNPLPASATRLQRILPALSHVVRAVFARSHNTLVLVSCL